LDDRPLHVGFCPQAGVPAPLEQRGRGSLFLPYFFPRPAPSRAIPRRIIALLPLVQRPSSAHDARRANAGRGVPLPLPCQPPPALRAALALAARLTLRQTVGACSQWPRRTVGIGSNVPRRPKASADHHDPPRCISKQPRVSCRSTLAVRAQGPPGAHQKPNCQ